MGFTTCFHLCDGQDSNLRILQKYILFIIVLYHSATIAFASAYLRRRAEAQCICYKM